MHRATVAESQLERDTPAKLMGGNSASRSMASHASKALPRPATACVVSDPNAWSAIYELKFSCHRSRYSVRSWRLRVASESACSLPLLPACPATSQLTSAGLITEVKVEMASEMYRCV